MISAGWLAKTNMAQYEGEEKWQPLNSMPEFNDSLPPSPVEPTPHEAAQPATAPKAPLNLKPFLRAAARILVLLILLGLVAIAGTYVARHAREIFKPAAETNASRRAAVTNSAAATNAAKTAPVTLAENVPAATQAVAVVKLAAAPTNKAPAAWERTSQPDSTAASTTVTNATPGAPARRCVSSRVDPKSTPFGEYDVAVIKTVQKKWFTLMDENPWLKQRTGRVVISFQLMRSGAVSGVKVLQTSGDGIQDYLCQQAVNDSKPFPRWPASAIGEKDSRDMQFTFQY